jgi:hypothetical protein
MARKSLAENTVPHLTSNSITLLRTLRQAVSLDTWESRKTVQANRLGLLKVKKKKLMLTKLGWQVAQYL